MKALAILIVGFALLAAACSSPEATVPLDFPTPPGASVAPTVVQAGQGQADQGQQTTAIAAPTPGSGIDPERLSQLRERLASGELTQEERNELRQQFQQGGGFGGGAGGPGGAIARGTINSIDGAMLIVGTPDGIVSATVGEETSIRITSQSGVDSLELGMQVSVFGERGESGTLLASTITVGGGVGGRRGGGGGGFGGRQGGGGGGGFGGRQGGDGTGSGISLTGTIETIDSGSVTIETAQGPLPITVGSDTVVRITVDGKIGDLEEGMTVLIRGQASEDGPIDAISITVVPEGSLPQPVAVSAALPAATAAPAPTSEAPTAVPEPLAPGEVRLDIVDGSEARYLVNEQLARLNLPSDAVGVTKAVEGSIVFGADGGIRSDLSHLTVDLSKLKSDRDLRDNFIKRRTLETDQYPLARFVPREAPGMPSPLPTEGEAKFQLVGEMTIHGVTSEFTWDVAATFEGDTVTGLATASFPFSQFDMSVPRVMLVLSVEDNIRLQIDFLMKVTE